jgi:hypothetical protein
VVVAVVMAAFQASFLSRKPCEGLRIPFVFRRHHLLPKTHLQFKSVCVVCSVSEISQRERFSPADVLQEEEERNRRRSVAVFWDLDNKPPKAVRPYDAALRLRDTAAEFGNVVDMVAYANRHAFIYLPQWVREERQEKKKLDVLESKGLVKPLEPYVCNYCGRKCKTQLALKKHFKQLHERERSKRLTHLSHLKGKRRIKYKEKLADKEERYNDVAREILVPKVGYGLAGDLKRAGVFVKTVEDRPQAADEALIKHMTHYIHRGLECLCLVSDDSDFTNVLRLARLHRLQIIVVGETMTLSRHADISFSWEEVATGRAMGRAQGLASEAFEDRSNEEALRHEIQDDSDLYIAELQDDSDQNTGGTSKDLGLKSGFRVSAFSEEEDGEWDSELHSVEEANDQPFDYPDWWDEDEDSE